MPKMYWFALKDCGFYQCLSPLHCSPVCRFHILDQSFSWTLKTVTLNIEHRNKTGWWPWQFAICLYVKSFQKSIIFPYQFADVLIIWISQTTQTWPSKTAIPVHWTGYRGHLVVSSVSALLGPGPRLLRSPQLSLGCKVFSCSCFTPDNCESGLDRNEIFCSMTNRNLSSFQQYITKLTEELKTSRKWDSRLSTCTPDIYTTMIQSRIESVFLWLSCPNKMFISQGSTLTPKISQ